MKLLICALGETNPPAIQHNSPLADAQRIALKGFRGMRCHIAEEEIIRFSHFLRTLGRRHPILSMRASRAGTRRRRTGQGIQLRCSALPLLSPTLPHSAEGTKKRGRAMKLSHVDGMNEAGVLRRAAPYFSRSQAALMRRIASTMFSSLVA